MDTFVRVRATQSGSSVFVLLDPEDADAVGGRKLSIGSHGYAQLCVPDGRVTLLHRWLLGLKVGDKRIGDHINGDPLDCRRSNLRILNAVASRCNTRGWGSTGYRGVYRARHGKPFIAKAQVAGKLTIIGRFDTAEEADNAVHAWRVANMPAYVERPGARRVDEAREPDAFTMWWQILELAGSAPRCWSLAELAERFEAHMGFDYRDDEATGWKLAEFRDAVKSGAVK